MNRLLFWIVCFSLIFSSAGSFGGPVDPVHGQIIALGTKRGNRNQSLILAKEALALHTKGDLKAAEARWLDAARADPSWWKPVYNLGCIRSLQRRPEEAVALLRLALERGRFLRGHEFLLSPSGMEDGDLILYLFTDSDLRPVRQSPRFPANRPHRNRVRAARPQDPLFPHGRE